MRNALLLLTALSINALAAGPANRPYDVQSYRLHLALDPAKDPETFEASVDIDLKATAPTDAIVLDRDGLEIVKSSVGKIGAKDQKDAKTVTIFLPHPLPKGGAKRITLTYRGRVRAEHDGLFKLRDPDEPARGPMFFTQLEATSARALFPCNDEPYDKALTEVLVSVPVKYTVVSNGKQVGDRKFKKGGEAWHEVHWKMQKPHSTYLVSLAIAPFAKVQSAANGTPLAIYVSESRVDKARYALKVTGDALAFMESYLGVKYPWPKYAQIGIPTFFWGGMENTSATHMNQERFLLNDPSSELEKAHLTGLTAHELAHQWFGDFVTMKWWNDVWLNESFASLMATRATAKIFGNEEADIQMKLATWDSYFRQEDGPRSHPIVDRADAGPDDAFDAINYDKGENVLRMLSYHLGEDKFRKGLRLYLEGHSYGNATNEDFFAAMEAASGEKLAAFRDSWLLHRGYPVVKYEGKWDADKKVYALTVVQAPNHPEDKTVFNFRLPLAFHRLTAPAFDREALLPVEAGTSKINVTLPAEPEWVTVNPAQEVLARVEQVERDEKALARQATGDPQPLARVWAAYALMGGLLEGKDISGDAEKSVLRVLNEDPSPYVRIAVLDGFNRMKRRYLPGDLAQGVMRLAKQPVEPGRDPHGWREFHSELLGALGKVEEKGTVEYLVAQLKTTDLPLDDLKMSARALASLAPENAPEILREALERHGPRGYKFRFVVLYAYGSYESGKAARELETVAANAAPDFWGQIGWVIRDNQTLKQSKEWAEFLKRFVLTEGRLGDEVKARLLETIEDVKNPEVESALRAIWKESPSERMKSVSKKILDKNFG